MSVVSPDGGAVAEEPAQETLESHRRFLWSLCYRMTGSPADAEDLVQETFVRALERPPRDVNLPMRPWLVRVAMNLSRDALRRRKSRKYAGLWLPVPIETPEGSAPMDIRADEEGPEARYGALESASYAFLVALEALTPAQRAVLLLRDAFDFSVKETALICEMSEANVKTTHHRARAAMAAYDAQRRPMDDSLRDQLQQTLSTLLACLATGEYETARRLLASDVRALSDGGGETFAALRPVVGDAKVARMYMKLASRASPQVRAELRTINGLPAIVLDDPDPKPPNARRAVLRVELDANGRIREIHSILSLTKLSGIRAPK